MIGLYYPQTVESSNIIPTIMKGLKQKMEKMYVFVYGTLMEGHINYKHFLAPQKPIGKGCLYGYRMYDLGYYPGIVPGDGKVKGEVFSITKETLAELDNLEGKGSLYQRVLEKVLLEDGTEIQAYVYYYLHSIKQAIEIPFTQQPYDGN